MVEKIKVGLTTLVLFVWGLSFFGIYKYFEWLFNVPLLTTAGVLGIWIAFLILVAEFFLSLVMLGALKGIAEA
jgi:uncharacterized membrane protein (DUF485 family)